jgi:hypothetical protein
MSENESRRNGCVSSLPEILNDATGKILAHSVQPDVRQILADHQISDGFNFSYQPATRTERFVNLQHIVDYIG